MRAQAPGVISRRCVSSPGARAHKYIGELQPHRHRTSGRIAEARPCIILARLAVTLVHVDKSRFDKLHVKLFLAIAGAIAALTLAAYFVFFVTIVHSLVARRRELRRWRR